MRSSSQACFIAIFLVIVLTVNGDKSSPASCAKPYNKMMACNLICNMIQDSDTNNEALPGGAPRSLAGISKCPLSALSYCFIRGSRRRWKYNSTAVCRYFI